MIWTLRTMRRRRWGGAWRCCDCREEIPVGGEAAGPVTNRLCRADRVCVRCCVRRIERGKFVALSERMYIDDVPTTGREARRKGRGNPC